MIDLIVQRSPADSQGNDIVDSLLTTQAAALRRGRNELDAKATAKTENRYQIIYRSGIRGGQLVQVIDDFRGTSFKAKVIGIHHSVSGGQALTDITIEKVSDFG